VGSTTAQESQEYFLRTIIDYIYLWEITESFLYGFCGVIHSHSDTFLVVTLATIGIITNLVTNQMEFYTRLRTLNVVFPTCAKIGCYISSFINKPLKQTHLQNYVYICWGNLNSLWQALACDEKKRGFMMTVTIISVFFTTTYRILSWNWYGSDDAAEKNSQRYNQNAHRSPPLHVQDST
jgi:hypothetical protein